MLVPKKLTIKAFGRFVESQVIDFTKLDNLTQLEAINNNTGGSSGSGKTTLAHALEYNLGLNDLPISVLQSRLTKEGLYTLGEYDSDGIPVIIERGKSKFSITVGDETISGSSKLTEEALDRVIGMDRGLFKKVLHKAQGSRGFFLEFGPSETHKFLTSCQGLEKEQAKILTLDTRLATLTSAETTLKSSVESSKSALQATQSAILGLGTAPTLEIDPGVIMELKNKYDAAKEILELVKNEHRADVEDLEKNRPQATIIPFDRSDIERLELEVGMILADVVKLEKVELERQSKVKDHIAQLTGEVSRLKFDEQTRQSEVKAKISSIRLEFSKFEQSEQVRQAEVKSRITLNQLSILRSRSESVEGGKAKSAAANLAIEFNKVRSSICPTCEQGWVNDAAKAKETDILTKLQECKKLVLAGLAADKEILVLEEEREQLDLEFLPRAHPESSNFLAQFKKLEAESQPRPVAGADELLTLIEQLKKDAQPQAIPEAIELKLKGDFKNKELTAIRQSEREHQSRENARTKDILSVYAQKQIELRTKHQNIIQDLQNAEANAHSGLKDSENKLRNFEESKKRYEESLSKLKEQHSRYEDKLRVQNAELDLVQQEIELATEAKKAIKSYLSCSFEDALDSIGDTATRFIRSIPNMATATIQFEGLKETKEGKVKEEVTCLISMDGEVGIPIKSLSGGERSSTDLAIDLAVIKFIEERTGKGIDLFILDEPFTGLDSKNILEALEMLKESSLDKRLIIVDHNPEASQSIENRITVIRDGLTSRVVQQ